MPAPPPTQPVRERERTIYVPYAEIEKIFTDGGKGVFHWVATGPRSMKPPARLLGQ